MTSTRITPTRLGFAAGAALLTTLAVGAPAFATNEFPPNAVLTVISSGCEGDVFYLRTTLTNPTINAATATFELEATNVDDGAGAVYFETSYTINPNGKRDLDIAFVEGVAGSVHIVSSDGAPPINYLFEVTPDCVPEVTTTIPATTIPATTVPETTIPATTIPAPDTTVAVFAPDSLPSTGSSSPILVALASGLLGVGILMRRATRQSN